PDPSEMDSHDDPDLDVCPYCRKMISEEAERCPHCGQYITAEQPASWTFAYVALAVAVGIAVLLVFFMRDSR
ncbi:MAG: hypothetical protein QOE14_2120, partial [Humisphaera sp.]|nr:hypothetical protein [Humisphaera sp.]